MTDSQNSELYHRYRPSKLTEIVGQPEVVAKLLEFHKRNEFPHAMLMAGPSGTGKTSTARIVAKRLGATEHDFREINSADCRGIDDIRKIQSEVGYSPFGAATVYYLDEIQSITSDAQNCFLKTLEEPPPHVYFILSTTHPQKLLPTIRSRCTILNFSQITATALEELVDKVAAAENLNLGPGISAKIADVAEGNARTALNILNSLIGISDQSAQLRTIEKTTTSVSGFEIAQGLMKSVGWPKIADFVKQIEDPEGARRIILGYSRTALMSGNFRAHQIIETFRQPFYDESKASQALFASACFGLCKPKR